MTITLNNFLTEWSYSGHLVRKRGPYNTVYSSGQNFENSEYQDVWCYSGQNVGVIKPQNVTVIVTPSTNKLMYSMILLKISEKFEMANQ